MCSHRSRAGACLLAAVIVGSLLTGLPGTTSAAAAPSAALTNLPTRPTKPLPVQARAALQRVEDIFSGRAHAASQSHPDHHGVAATIALRDLALSKEALPPAERERAERYLARPTDDGDDGAAAPKYGTATDQQTCSATACVHYVTSTEHAATPTFADHALTAVGTTQQTYSDQGYRAPADDSAAPENGGSGVPDIYLADIGPDHIFGYCAPEDWANPDIEDDYSAYGYCVLDNDYANQEYGNAHTPSEFLQVTTAHEYFHLVQFAYDLTEDVWFMEATATWAEDEVFDDVNDNVGFLGGPMSPMTNPRVSMDHSPGNWYSHWLFIRFLSERYDPAMVRDMWDRTDSVGTAPDDYSLQALRAVVASAGDDWNDLWRRFADANRRPKRAYAEARSGEATYPNSALKASYTLSPGSRSRAPSIGLDHLTSAVYRFTPSTDMKWGWKLKVKVDGNTPTQGGAALATISRKDGRFTRVAFELDSAGVRTRTLLFGRGAVNWVEITVVNASTRIINCFPPEDPGAPYYSCYGTPQDDNRTTRLWATAVKS